MGAVMQLPLARVQSWVEVFDAYASSSIVDNNNNNTDEVWTIYIADGLKQVQYT